MAKRPTKNTFLVPYVDLAKYQATALNNANDVLGNKAATKAEIEATIKALDEAFNNLEVDKTELNAIIDAKKGTLQGDYSNWENGCQARAVADLKPLKIEYAHIKNISEYMTKTNTVDVISKGDKFKYNVNFKM